MAMLLSFLGGAARQLTTDIEKAEENAREDAKLGFSGLYKRYEENSKANRELENKMNEDRQWIETNYSNATVEQKAALLGNPIALDALKKTDDPYKIDLSNYIKIAQGNESRAVQAERIQALPSLVGKVKESITEKTGGSPLGGLLKDFGESAYGSSMERMAKAQGMSLADLQATSRATRPATNAQFDMSVLAKAPNSVEDMVKSAEVARVQAGQKFGKDSKEYKAANDQVVSLQSEIVKVDKSLDERANRLNIALMDAAPKDKPKIASELKQTQQAIKNHKNATTSKSDAEKEKTYNNIKTSVMDAVNTAMREEKGAEWRKYIDFKTFTDPTTGQTITSRTQKAGLTTEQQQELFAAERQITMQALKNNGYVTANGQPRYPAVAEIMNNFGLNTAVPYVPPAPAAAAPTQPATPASAPQAAPTKTVSRAKVEEQASLNKTTYEVAAQAAMKQGYTIR